MDAQEHIPPILESLKNLFTGLDTELAGLDTLVRQEYPYRFEKHAAVERLRGKVAEIAEKDLQNLRKMLE